LHLTLEDRRWVRSHRGAVVRIGLAVQMSGLRFLGFVPADLAGAPREVVQFMAKQIGVAAATFTRYIRELTARALEHDTPSVLFRQALQQLRATPRALRQMAPERRHPILLAALVAAHTEIVDETVRLFDMALASADGNARDRVAGRQLEAARSDVATGPGHGGPADRDRDRGPRGKTRWFLPTWAGPWPPWRTCPAMTTSTNST
jgi:hypothetical protein